MKIEINKVATIKNDEISLFREMSIILSKQYNTTFIQETHQHYVSFNSLTIGRTAKREIADLWIIAFSPSSMRIRMTFLQAKFHRGLLNSHATEFRGDYFQYELLSTRAAITNAGSRVNLPTDILSGQCLPSVGSYGVFFVDSINQIDLAYCSARYLTPATKPTHYAGYQTQLKIPYYMTKTYGDCDCGGWKELISCFNIDEFISSLLSLEIGAQFEPRWSNNGLQFIKSILQPYDSQSTVLDLLNIINRFPPSPLDNDASKGSEGLPCSILLINTDKKK